MSLVEYLRYLIDQEKTMSIVEVILENPILQSNTVLGEVYSSVFDKPKIFDVLFGTS